jgi:uncharacterized protein with HEPN domain
MSGPRRSARRSRLSDRTRQALLDILDNGTLARSFVDGMEFDAFADGRRTFHAVTRCLEIISEASRRLDEALRARHPELPWRAIMGGGNVHRHEYDNVAESFVWRTVRDSLPGLLAVVELELVQHTEREGAAPGLPPPG